MDNKADHTFLQAINQHVGILHKVGCMYCDNREDREDLKQEILFQLWKSYPTFKGKSAVSTWIYRVALNTAITFHKKQKRMVTEPEPCPMLAEQMQANETDTLNEQLGAMHKAIAQLSNVDKALVTLYLEDKSYKEMSDIMGISQVNARVKLTRIKERLKKMMNN